MTPQTGDGELRGDTPGAPTSKAAGGQTDGRDEPVRGNASGTTPIPPGLTSGVSSGRENGTDDSIEVSSEVSSEGPDGPDAHGIFDERFRLFADPFGSTCERENVKTAVFIVDDPKIPRQPVVFLRGNKYEAAKLLAALLRQLQQQILRDIGTHG